MSGVSKRKRITNELASLDSANSCIPADGRFVAKVDAPAGNNLHEVLAVDPTRGESLKNDPGSSGGHSEAVVCRFLVSMPTRLRKSFYIKRGDFVLCQPIEEGDKVKAEIVMPLISDAIEEIKAEGVWPSQLDLEQTGNNESADASKPISIEHLKDSVIERLKSSQVEFSIIQHESIILPEKMIAFCQKSGGLSVKHVILSDAKNADSFHLVCLHPDSSVNLNSISGSDAVGKSKLKLSTPQAVEMAFRDLRLNRSTLSLLVLLTGRARSQNCVKSVIIDVKLRPHEENDLRTLLFFPFFSNQESVGIARSDFFDTVVCGLPNAHILDMVER